MPDVRPSASSSTHSHPHARSWYRRVVLLGALTLLTSAASREGGGSSAVDEPSIAAPPTGASAWMQARSSRIAGTGQLSLRNASSMDVRVEVRLAGEGMSCDEAPGGTVLVLPAGRRWLIASQRPICWRRAEDLSLPVVQWRPWERRVLGGTERVEVQL